MRILLAEAEEGGLDEAAEALTTEGHEVQVVNSSQMLFEALTMKDISLVVLDDLLDLGRIEAVDRIRKDMRFSDPERLAIIVIFFLGDPLLLFPEEYGIMQFEQSEVPSVNFLRTVTSIAHKG